MKFANHALASKATLYNQINACNSRWYIHWSKWGAWTTAGSEAIIFWLTIIVEPSFVLASIPQKLLEEKYAILVIASIEKHPVTPVSNFKSQYLDW